MKNFIKFIILFLNIYSISAYSQNDGAITPKLLSKIKSTYLNTTSDKAIRNAVTTNNINKLSLNRENTGKFDNYFSNKVKVSGITDQKSSGRCWLFTGLNILRPITLNKLNLSDFAFSQNYCFFWDQFEKSNLFLEAIITTRDKPLDDRTVEWLFKNPIGDGGQWTTFAGIVQKYGLVPAEVMPETYNTDNTSVISVLLARKLRENGLIIRDMAQQKKNVENLRSKKIEMLSEIYRMLVTGFGEPPSEFDWRYKSKDDKISETKQYTPLSFYNEMVGINLSDYVMFMDNPAREYNKVYEIEYDRNMIEGFNWKYINLPASVIKDFAKNSILANDAVYFGCDVGKQLNSEAGILDVNNYDYNSLLGVNFGMDKKQRILSFDSGSSHGMALVGVEVDKDGKPTKWMLENSWGDKAGNKGYLTMTDRWFDEYMFRLVVNKKYISAEALKLLEQKPVLLPPYDQMFSPEN
ncbi:MAG: C1 family peptidase [Lentimicrobiaceae bacterium]|nr:C1 family peptidase [Lentimicrobiaceae bacterium]